MDESKIVRLIGTVEHIVFQNHENGYTVMEISCDDELFTVTGLIAGIKSGESITAEGTWKNHPTFGMQLDAKIIYRNKPQTTEAVLRYLSSGAIKGIGTATASKLVDLFGENTLEVMEDEPLRMCVIKGISKPRALEISQQLKDENGMREMLVNLSKYNISPNEAVKIWRTYGNEYRAKIDNDPYCLCQDYLGIDFYRCDAIAQTLEKPIDNINRVKAGLIFVLKHNLSNGHTCLPSDKLIEAATRLLNVKEETLISALDEMTRDMSLISIKFDDKNYIYLRRLYECEGYISERLKLIKRYPAKSIVGIENYIKLIEERNGIEYADLQKEAIRKALGEGLLVLTGGPGTGKTTTLKGIISILKEKGEKVFLAAPTGRAAKRMNELTGEEAKTIHRLLEVEWDQDDNAVFARNEKNLLECDAMVVDELSMVDAILFESLLRALPLGCRLVLVGDCDQLPSVGAGNVLHDIIESDAVPTVALKEIFRQAMESLIITNSHRVIEGQMPQLNDKTNDFFFIPMHSADRVSDTIVSLFTTRLPAAFGYSPENDIQVLCPGRKGEVGTIEMNKKLQAALNPPSKDKREITMGGFVLREGDKVIQIKNDYDIIWTKDDESGGEGIFNGDIGTVITVDKRTGTLLVKIDDKYVTYDSDKIKEIELAYALTVHKSQGNEFSAVIMPMFRFSKQLIYRNLFYTAITRAKSLLILVGDESIISEMVKNDKKTKRYSGLSKMLKEEING